MQILLIENLPKKKWPLLLFTNKSAPTIDQYNKNPLPWREYEHDHGIYEITLPIRKVKSWGDDLRLMKAEDHFREFISARVSVQELLNGIALGNVWYNNLDSDPMVTFRGVFKKHGSQINFYLLEKKYEGL